MNHDEGKELIRKCLKAAFGKSMNDAVDMIWTSISGLMHFEETFQVVELDPLPPPIVSSPDVTPPRPVPGGELKELRPVIKERSTIARKRRSLEDIHSIVEAAAPPYIEVTPEGWENPLPLNRIMSNDQQAGSFMLAYQPAKIDPGTPYPKMWFWTTEDGPPNVEEAIEWIKGEAVKMYRKRSGPINRVVKEMAPLSTRMNKEYV